MVVSDIGIHFESSTHFGIPADYLKRYLPNKYSYWLIDIFCFEDHNKPQSACVAYKCCGTFHTRCFHSSVVSIGTKKHFYICHSQFSLNITSNHSFSYLTVTSCLHYECVGVCVRCNAQLRHSCFHIYLYTNLALGTFFHI